MSLTQTPGLQISQRREPLPLSLLNDYLYCLRRAALKLVEGWRRANEYTARGDLVHAHADFAGYEVTRGVRILRALPVWSDRLEISGKCDLVELHPDGTVLPVEYKVGKRMSWENDDVQLCTQALCLEEMFQTNVASGAVFHAISQRRRVVEFTVELRSRTEDTITHLHRLLDNSEVPPAIYKPACEKCSLFDTCLPKATCDARRASVLAANLFKVTSHG